MERVFCFGLTPYTRPSTSHRKTVAPLVRLIKASFCFFKSMATRIKLMHLLKKESFVSIVTDLRNKIKKKRLQT
jgi:hypothetical protein